MPCRPGTCLLGSPCYFVISFARVTWCQGTTAIHSLVSHRASVTSDTRVLVVAMWVKNQSSVHFLRVIGLSEQLEVLWLCVCAHSWVREDISLIPAMCPALKSQTWKVQSSP